MGADLLSWIFHSPRRLALTAVVLLGGILVAGSVLVNAAPGLHTGTQGQPATATATATPGASSTPPAVVPDAAPFVTAAIRFVQEWATIRPGESVTEWRARVDPLATPDLAAALELTDPKSLPNATPSGRPDVRFVSDSSALIAVPLSDGTAVLVTVVSQPTSHGTQWRASDVQPDVGDSGLTGSTP